MTKGSTKPIGLNGGINFYAYVQNNPVNWIDPFGLMGSPVTQAMVQQAQNAAASPVGQYLQNKATSYNSMPLLGEIYKNAKIAYDKLMDSLQTPPIDPFSPLPPGWTYDPTLNKTVPPKGPICTAPR